ncbi:hypothetical protein REK76_16920 [Nocardia farcinica]|nr:hypothetical protein [Nocardia farcinica]
MSLPLPPQPVITIRSFTASRDIGLGGRGCSYPSMSMIHSAW